MTPMEDWMLRTTAPYMRADEQILWMGSFQKGGGRKADRQIKKEAIQLIFLLLHIFYFLLFYFMGKHVLYGAVGARKLWMGFCIIFLIASIIFSCVTYHSNASASKNWYMITDRQVLIWVNTYCAGRKIIADQLSELTDITVTMGENHIGRIDYKINGIIVYDKVSSNLAGNRGYWTKWVIYLPKCNFHNLCGIANPEEVAALLNNAICRAKKEI